ncbi:MAG TPA: DNA polymerase II, partial [Gammaproteobacteria bacterium]|nr:DNA polymerase II [Gammaproteobacteria bacterium]
GFILQASYRVEAGGNGERRPVVHLYGRLEDGRTFLVRDDRQHPHFYIRDADATRARSLGAAQIGPSDKRTFDGAPVARVEVEAPPDVPGLRDRLHSNGIDTFEADVRFASRYLIERGIKGGCEIVGAPRSGGRSGSGVAGEPRVGEGTDLLVFENPEFAPAAVEIEPRVLSFDIETDPDATRLLAISLYAPGVDEVLIVDPDARALPERAVHCADEHAALDAFCERVRADDPDVLTGWNTIDFDLTVLQRIAARLEHPLRLGRDQGALRLRKAEGYFGSGQATIPGRVVLDGIDLLRGAFVRMDDYSLDAVAREVLGEGKALVGDARERIAEIQHNYAHDLAAFAVYARTDARLAYQIVEKLNLVPLAFARSRLTGMTPDRVAASIASFDFLYLTELERRHVVAPTVRNDDSRVYAAQQGGHVLAPVTGLHKNVWVFDFKSLYPSIIRTFNVDPLGYVPSPGEGDDLIRTPDAAFRREPAILPRLLDELFPRREAAKKSGDDVASQAIKILMNSFYGVLGTPACRFFNPALANAITGLGRDMLLWSKRWFEAAGYEVLYGDTDSLFVRSGRDAADAPNDANAADDARAEARGLAATLNAELTSHIAAQWRVESRLELEFEKLYLKLFLPHARHSARGASKRYAGLVHGARGGDPAAKDLASENLEFVGLEVVRRDWTALAKRVQRELYRRLFVDESVDAYLADVVRRVRAGELDEELVYRKNLRKAADDYTASTPPHVAAARKSTQPASRLVRYVMTTAGPEPLDNLEHALDREHYVEKQVKPVAEPVLEALGLDFERVIGDARQADLF